MIENPKQLKITKQKIEELEKSKQTILNAEKTKTTDLEVAKIEIAALDSLIAELHQEVIDYKSKYVLTYEIDTNELFFLHNSKEHYNDEKILAILLLEGYIFLNDLQTPEGLTTCVYVVANDVFAWACADAELITNNELGDFYKMTRQKWGDVKWLCIKRNMQPQAPMIRDIKAQGYWDEVFENLPKNQYD